MAAAQPRCLFRKHTRAVLAEPDARVGLTDVLEKVCQVQALDRGLREVMLGKGRGPERHSAWFGERSHERVGGELRSSACRWSFD
jgi:hypothetical protein